MPTFQDLPAFIKDFKSVVIGTIDADGLPYSSYAPFVYHDYAYHIFISDIARHASNLRRNATASLLFIEDESRCANIFARKRISLQCEVTMVSRDAQQFTETMSVFEQKFDPSMVAMLAGMKDFNLYTLRSLSGEATFGFGEAYSIGGEQMQDFVPRRGGSGHR